MNTYSKLAFWIWIISYSRSETRFYNNLIFSSFLLLKVFTSSFSYEANYISWFLFSIDSFNRWFSSSKHLTLLKSFFVEIYLKAVFSKSDLKVRFSYETSSIYLLNLINSIFFSSLTLYSSFKLSSDSYSLASSLLTLYNHFVP